MCFVTTKVGFLVCLVFLVVLLLGFGLDFWFGLGFFAWLGLFFFVVGFLGFLSQNIPLRIYSAGFCIWFVHPTDIVRA